MKLQLPYCIALSFVLVMPGAAVLGQDTSEALEKTLRMAAEAVAPSVVKIETSGGLEVIGKAAPKGVPGPPQPGIRKGVGPTTGLVVAADGYIITSSFNFANKPTDIFVTVPGRTTRYVAKVVSADQTRMTTLLKIDAKDLPVPAVYPNKEIRIGQWAVALGRTLDANTDHPVSMSIGIISATNRIFGKMIQTDAKVSPVNYGGPLISVDGRVFGILVPASTRADDDISGVEWYDSGIGFAVPLEDVMVMLPRMKEGKDLRRGLLGITPEGTELYSAAAVIGAIQPDSAASRAGIKVGDKIVMLDGKKVPHFSAVQHILGPKYEGDVIAVKVVRDDKELDFPSVTLLGTSTSFVNPFLGILPLRDDPGPGVPIRFVYPKSPAETAGIKVGDRIMKLGEGAPAKAKGAPKKGPAMPAIKDRAALTAALAGLAPGTEIKIELKRKEGDKTETVTLKLGTQPSALPDKLPLPSSAGKAKEGKSKEKITPLIPMSRLPIPSSDTSAAARLFFVNQDDPKKTAEKAKDDKKDKEKEKVETGFLKRTDGALGREYWVYVPENYDSNVSHGLIVWFHPSGKGGKDGELMSRTFRDFCEDYHFIMMGPKSQNADGWVPSETEQVVEEVRTVLGQYTTDKSRVIAHGMGMGGQMAFYVGFHVRDLFRGVAAIGSVLGTPPKDNVATQPLSFFMAWGDKDPLAKDIAAGKAALEEKRFPVIGREMTEAGKEYLDTKTFDELLIWMDSLDML